MGKIINGNILIYNKWSVGCYGKIRKYNEENE